MVWPSAEESENGTGQVMSDGLHWLKDDLPRMLDVSWQLTVELGQVMSDGLHCLKDDLHKHVQ